MTSFLVLGTGYAQGAFARNVEFVLLSDSSSLVVGQDVTVNIMIKNPGNYPLSSAEVAVSYDTNMFTGKSIDYGANPYFGIDLYPSEENKFRPDGIVRLGRASLTAGTAPAGTEIIFAKIILTPKVNASTAKISIVDTVDNQASLSAKVLENGSYVQVLASAKPTDLVLPVASSALPVKSEVIPTGEVALIPTSSTTNNTLVNNNGLATVPVREAFTSEMTSAPALDTSVVAADNEVEVKADLSSKLKKAPATPKSGPFEIIVLLLCISVSTSYYLHFLRDKISI